MGLTREQIITEARRRGIIDEEGSPIPKRAASESPSYLEKGKKAVAQLGRNVAAGIGDIADLPALPFELARYGGHHAAKALGYAKEAPTFGKWMPELGEKIAHKIDTATGGYTKPTTGGERMTETVTRALTGLPTGLGAAAGLAKIPLKMASKTAKGLKNISMPTLGNVGATAGGSAASQQYIEHVPNPSTWGSLAAGIVGGGIGGSGAPILREGVGALTRNPKDTFAKTIGKTMKFDPKRYEKVLELGVEPSLGMSSKSSFPSGIEQMLAHHPVSGDVMEDLFHKQHGKLSEHLGITNPEEAQAHHLAKEGAQRHKERMSEEFEKLKETYLPLETEFKKHHKQIDVNDVLKDIENKYMVGRDTASEVKTFEDSFPGEIYTKLKKSIDENRNTNHSLAHKYYEDLRKKGISERSATQEVAKEFGTSLEAKEGASFTKLLDLKEESLIFKNSLNPKDPRKAKATHVHKLLRDKLEDYVEKHGTPEEREAYKASNALWSDYASRDQSDLKHYVYNLTETRNETTAFDKLTKDPKFLQAATKELDREEKRQLAQSIMMRAGQRQGSFNTATAYTKWHKWSPSVQKEYLKFFPTTKERTDFLNTMDLIGENKKKIEKLANTSKTALIGSNITRYVGYGTEALKLAGSAATMSNPLPAIGALASIKALDLLAKGTAHMFTDRVFLDRINKVMKATSDKSAQNHLNLLLKAPTVKQMLAAGAKPSMSPHHEHEE